MARLVSLGIGSLVFGILHVATIVQPNGIKLKGKIGYDRRHSLRYHIGLLEVSREMAYHSESNIAPSEGRGHRFEFCRVRQLLIVIIRSFVVSPNSTLPQNSWGNTRVTRRPNFPPLRRYEACMEEAGRLTRLLREVAQAIGITRTNLDSGQYAETIQPQDWQRAVHRRQ